MLKLWNSMNLPNRLTMARFIMTMCFLGFASVPPSYAHHRLFWQIGFILAILAGTTDYLDGYLARKYNLVTDFGKLMDPLTDKIFTVSCFVILTEYQVVPGWITALILTREFSVTGLRTMAANKGNIMPAAFSGKLKTMLQMAVLALGGCIWVGWIPGLADPLGVPWFYRTWIILLTVIAAVTIYSGLEYFYKGRELYLKHMK